MAWMGKSREEGGREGLRTPLGMPGQRRKRRGGRGETPCPVTVASWAEAFGPRPLETQRVQLEDQGARVVYL